jgi:hypothetical protein
MKVTCGPFSRRFAHLVNSQILSFFLVAIWGLVLFCPPAVGQQTDAGLDAHLSAGEFGPARELVEQLPDARQRDEGLFQIAAAQRRAGARLAAATTATAIQNDRLRSDSLQQLAEGTSAGSRGGAALADFDSLIELITSTITPDSWDVVGGPGAIEAFPGGVFVDSSGVLLRASAPLDEDDLRWLRESSRRPGGNRDVRRPSTMRKVSLNRLARQAQRLWALGRELPPDQRNLAGLRRIQYVFFYPDSRDIVIAGPADDWTLDREERVVSVADGRPVPQLDDFVVVLRNALSTHNGRFGCSITPRKDNLAAVQVFLRESAGRPLKRYERDAWLATLRKRLGRQDIDVFGIDPYSRVARILVEADYHMKLIGMGLEEGTLGVKSYLDRISEEADAESWAMDVLRWWFTLNYDALAATPARDAFQLGGVGVKVLSENELLTERGERLPTGESDTINRQFARDFTRQYSELAVKYPIYAELQNIFDLALVAAVIRSADLAGQIGWTMPFLGPDGSYEILRGHVPAEVDSILNHRIVDRTRFVVGVSGGVSVDTRSLVEPQRLEVDPQGILVGERAQAERQSLPPDRWWWD